MDEQSPHESQANSQSPAILLDDKGFVSDSEAAHLAWYAGHRVIEVKVCLLGLLEGLLHLLMVYRHSDKVSQQIAGTKVYDVIEGLIAFGRLRFALLKYVQKVRKRSLPSLTLTNLVGGDP
jgi:hypothetical protein